MKNWALKSFVFKTIKYIIIVSAIMYIAFKIPTDDRSLIIGIIASVLATLITKCSDLYTVMNEAACRTKRSVSQFMFFYRVNDFDNCLNGHSLYIIKQLYNDVLIDASPLCNNNIFQQLSRAMCEMIGHIEKKYEFACEKVDFEQGKDNKKKINLEDDFIKVEYYFNKLFTDESVKKLKKFDANN